MVSLVLLVFLISILKISKLQNFYILNQVKLPQQVKVNVCVCTQQMISDLIANLIPKLHVYFQT